MSVSADLVVDSERDLRDIGALDPDACRANGHKPIKIYNITKLP